MDVIFIGKIVNDGFSMNTFGLKLKVLMTLRKCYFLRKLDGYKTIMEMKGPS